MNLSSLQSRVRALRRKLALYRAQLVLQHLADELCLQWASAHAGRQPLPDPHAFILRTANAGFRLPSFTAVFRYLERCRAENQPPTPQCLLRTLLPRTW